jgi:transposase
MKHTLYTLTEFKKDFPNEEVCLEHIFKQKYVKTCRCGKGSFYKVRGRKCYACSACARQVYPLKNTIYAGSSTNLVLWFYALYLLTESEGKLSAKDLQRELRVTYKTAWRMKNKIKKVIKKTDSEIIEESRKVNLKK